MAPALVDPSDPFSSVAVKLRALFGLPRDARILLVGRHFDISREDYRAAFDFVDVLPDVDAVEAYQAAARFDLVCLDVFTARTRRPALSALARAVGLLAPGGYLLVASSHTSLMERMAQAWRGVRTPGLSLSPGVVHRTLRRAGSSAVKRLLAFPCHAEADEFFTPREAAANRPSFGRLRDRAAARMGVVRFTHPDSLFVVRAGATTHACLPLLTHLARALASGSSDPEPVGVAIRSRGALILQCAAEPEGYVVRIALSPKVRARVGRNAACTSRLLSADGLPPEWHGLVPRPLTRFLYHDAEVFVESRVSGIEAWRLPPRSTRAARATTDALAFADALGTATGRPSLVGEALFNELFRTSLHQLPARFHDAAVGSLGLDSIIRLLGDRIVGKTFRIGLGHGDYHLGNILADRASGRLTAVIDWDTYLEKEIIGVDRLHFLLALEARGHVMFGAEAFSSLASRCTPEERTLLAIAVLRTIERSSHFPSEFRTNAPQYATWLHAACELLSA